MTDFYSAISLTDEGEHTAFYKRDQQNMYSLKPQN